MTLKQIAYLIPMLLLTMVAVASSADEKIYYKGMLGSYGKDNEFPFYLLSTPSGTNVWGESAKSKLNGKWDLNKKPDAFNAIGNFYVAKKTKIKIEAAIAVSVTIDNLGYGLTIDSAYNAASAVVEMAAGLHVIKLSVSNSSEQVPKCRIMITDVTGAFEAPIFVTKSDLDKFLAKYPKGAIEVSGWDVKASLLDLKIAK